MYESSTLHLQIGRSTPSSDSSFGISVLLDGHAIAPHRNLSTAECARIHTMATEFTDIVRQVHKTEERVELLESIGSELFETWLAPVWDRFNDIVRSDVHRRIAIGSDIPNILNLPWEILRLPDGSFLGRSPRYAVRRVPRVNGTLSPSSPRLPARPLRLLFFASAPIDQATLEYEREEAQLYRAIADAGADVVIDSGDLGTFEELRQRVIAFQPHMIHLSGHGVVQPDGLGYFAFENERGETDLRSSRDIRQILAGRHIQPVFVSACESGQAPVLNAIGGLCQGLVSEEIPLAIGWSTAVTDTSSTRFMGAMYHAIAAGEEIDRALIDGRDAIYDSWQASGDPSWALPVLYAATDQSHVVDPNRARSRELPPRRGTIQRALPGMTEGFAESFVGRRREQQRWLPALRDGTLQMLVLTGLGGAGKSTLTTRIANKLEASGFRVIPIPSSERNLLSAGRLIAACSDAFLEAGLRNDRDLLNDPQLPIVDRLRLLVRVLNREAFVLVFDNFEVNLDPDSRQIADPDIAAFLNHLVGNLSGASRVIMTTRYPPEFGVDTPRSVQIASLADFPESVVLKFLLRDDEVERRYYAGDLPADLLHEVYRLVGGAPRFLAQVRALLRAISVEDLRRDLDAFESADGVTLSDLRRLRDEYCEQIITSRLFSSLSSESQLALCKIAVFDVPVPLAGFAAASGLSKELVLEYVQQWRHRAFAHSVVLEDGSELWTIYGLLRNWLLQPERLSPSLQREASAAAGEYLYAMVDEQEDDVSDVIGINWIDTLIESRALFIKAQDYLGAVKPSIWLSGRFLLNGWLSSVVDMNLELTNLAPIRSAMNFLGDAFKEMDNFDAAELWYRRSLTSAQGVRDVDYANALQGMGGVKYGRRELQDARIYIMDALLLWRELGGRGGEGVSLGNLASVELALGNHLLARQLLDAALESLQEVEDLPRQATTLSKLASLNYLEDRYEEAKEQFEKSLAIKTELGMIRSAPKAFQGLGLLAMEQGRWEDARQSYSRAGLFAQENQDWNGIAEAYHGLGSVALAKGELHSAKEYFDEAMRLYEQNDNKMGEMSVLNNLGYMACLEENFEEAYQIFERSRMLHVLVGDNHGIISVMHNIACVEMNRGSVDIAEKFLINCVYQSLEINDLMGMARSLSFLSAIAYTIDKLGEATGPTHLVDTDQAGWEGVCDAALVPALCPSPCEVPRGCRNTPEADRCLR